MNEMIDNDKKFKEAIGSFIIAFSQLEYGLVFLCSMTEFDLRKKDTYITKYIGFPFEKKVKHLSEFIEECLNEIKPTWDSLKNEIDLLNRERRFLVHGFMSYSLPKETITTQIKEGKSIIRRELTLEEIKNYTTRLQHLNTGENGINGEFHIMFTKTVVNKWNNLVNDQSKIVYKVNDQILSNWKGNH